MKRKTLKNHNPIAAVVRKLGHQVVKQKKREQARKACRGKYLSSDPRRGSGANSLI